MEFELGRTYSGYKFLDVANRSKTGVEYRVQNTLAQRMELLKALPPSDQGDQEAADRFLREMRVRARLSHPNIVTFFTALPIDGQMVMTTELFEGLPLADRLQLGPLPWQDALEAARQLLAAAACAHSLKIVHRDITPENIVIGPDGVLKLTNFRFAIAVNSPRPSESGAIVGSPKYISPEQVKGVQDVDERSDLYAIGIVLYEMLCGRTPFDGRSQFEVMLAHVSQPPAPPAEVNPSLPKQLNAIVLKALAKDPEHRYQSAAAFADALEWVSSQPRAEALEPQEFSLPDVCHELPAPEAVEPPVAEPVAAFEPAPPTGLHNLPEQVSHAFSLPDLCHELPAAEAVPPLAAETVEPPVAEPVAAFELAPPTGLNNLPEQVGQAFSLPDFCHELPAAEAVPPLAAVTVEPPLAEPVAAFEPAPSPGLNNLPEQMGLAFGLPDFCHQLPAAEAVPPVAAEPLAAAEILAAEAVEPPAAEPVAAAEPLAVETIEPPAAEPVVAEAVQPLTAEPVATAEPLAEDAVAAVEPLAAEAVEPLAAEPVALETVEPPAAEPVVAEAVQPLTAEPVGPTAEPVGPTALPPDPIKADLWAAAAIVAQAAAAPARPSQAAADALKPLAELVEAAPVPAPPAMPPPPAPNPSLHAVPSLATRARRGSESVQWAIFGSSAAFLGVVWLAIWLAVGGQ